MSVHLRRVHDPSPRRSIRDDQTRATQRLLVNTGAFAAFRQIHPSLILFFNKHLRHELSKAVS